MNQGLEASPVLPMFVTHIYLTGQGFCSLGAVCLEGGVDWV